MTLAWNIPEEALELYRMNDEEIREWLGKQYDLGLKTKYRNYLLSNYTREEYIDFMMKGRA